MAKEPHSPDQATGTDGQGCGVGIIRKGIERKRDIGRISVFSLDGA